MSKKPGPIRFCPSCGSGQKLSVAYGKRLDPDIDIEFVSLDMYCGVCGWSGYIGPDLEEWEGDRWVDTHVIKL